MRFGVVAVAVALVAALPYVSDRLLGAYAPIQCAPDSALVVVTGISSGIGQDAAMYLIHKGYTVVGTVRKQSDYDSALRKAVGAKGRLLPTICDVSRPSDVRVLGKYVRGLTRLSKTGTKVGKKQLRLTGLVNNAGVSAAHSVEDWLSGQVSQDAEKLFGVNVVALVNVTATLLPHLIESAGVCGSARVVNVGSLAGFATRGSSSIYGGTKGAVERVSDGMRRLFSPKGVHTSIVEPGFVQSNMCNRAECQHNQAKDTTTPAIYDALTSSRPKPRYLVAGAFLKGVGAIPAWLVAALASHLPCTLSDSLFFLDADKR